MDLLGLNKFMVLLWKNFTLKRRQCTALVAELILTVLFVGVLLLTRRFLYSEKAGPFSYPPQPVDELPVFLRKVPSSGVWELAFVPSKSVVVKDIVETVKRDLHYNFKVQGFPSEGDFEEYVKQGNNSERVVVAFVFDHEFKNSHDPLPLKVKYYLRFSSSQRNKYVGFFRPGSWETDTLFPKSPSIGPRSEQANGGSPGYISEGFLLMQHALDKAIMKYHNHKTAQQLFTNVNVFVQRFPYPRYDHDYFYVLFSVFAPLVILFVFIVNYLTIIQSVVWEKENRLKEYQLMIGLSNWMLWAAYFFTFLTLYLVIIFLTCLLFFVKASVCLLQLNFKRETETRISSSYAQMTLIKKLAFSLSSNVVMALGTKYLVRAETDKIGIKWSNVFSPNTVENFVFAYILGIFLLDAVLYGLVAWYIEAVFPGEYGVPKPWNFFLLEFRVHNTTKLVVKDLSLNVYEGQITVLLGHNGAGKSTTLSILSGLYPATSGEAYVNGFAISKQMVQIRKTLGLCPQQDLLFNYLTVSEHLYFYCMIKGVPRKMYPIEIDRMLSAFNLIEKRNAFSASLSGGMKRKLSVIIALIGDSKVVILDEPTAGMDPASRRTTRDLLQQYKRGRTILLTTHYMDEADILGDRIAIMVKGSLRCCGSSLFLKNIYGVGYHIVIVKAPHCNVEEISKLIYYHIPSAALEKNVMNELSFLLPKEYTHRFEALFTDLERRHTELGIASFGVTITTMEEVFFRLSEGDQVAINIHFGMALLVSGFCLLTVTERITKAKLIQFLSGVYVLAYWLSALLWDLTIFFIACCLLLGVFKVCQLDMFLTDYHFLDTMLIFMLFGWSAIPLVYLLSFLFSQSTSAYIKLMVFSYLSGIFSIIIDATLQFETESMVSNSTRTFILRSLLLLPNYNLGKCIMNYLDFYNSEKMCMENPYAFLDCDEKTLWKLRAFLNRYIYFGIYKIYQKGKVSEELSGECEDEDVENERKRILEQPQELLNSSVLIKELIKIYFKCPVILAVKNISIAIQKGECFGLLGLNGAGKTTTFQILTGEETATSGHVFVDGFSITDNIQKVKARVGYCPQSDALLEYMTGREIMIMYARLWGVSESQIQQYVSKWLTSLQLESHADKIIRTYSGGNKRRLSTAIALMGKPTIILLDEPSTGMDPVARRLLWDAVMQARESGKTIIITSHRMEECDAFCTRLAIMVKGKFVCLGSPQHLKNKFGDVYILKVKVKTDTHKHTLNDFKDFITMKFPGQTMVTQPVHVQQLLKLMQQAVQQQKAIKPQASRQTSLEGSWTVRGHRPG
ncbi:ATP-binding cassette sub-family A member 3 [Myotis davidii]|uniref:ATP-binding cassette sub-family A member 3 n=1 Tax=Myotis davidii TaxID=225400 RepID=L5MJT3_MYODS|nr:ATP-binding cassette sub-family A member 3 [Myotis davidii]